MSVYVIILADFAVWTFSRILPPLLSRSWCRALSGPCWSPMVVWASFYPLWVPCQFDFGQSWCVLICLGRYSVCCWRFAWFWFLFNIQVFDKSCLCPTTVWRLVWTLLAKQPIEIMPVIWPVNSAFTFHSGIWRVLELFFGLFVKHSGSKWCLFSAIFEAFFARVLTLLVTIRHTPKPYLARVGVGYWKAEGYRKFWDFYYPFTNQYPTLPIC